MIKQFITNLEAKLVEQKIDVYQISYSSSQNNNLKVFAGKVDSSSFSDKQYFSLAIKIGKKIGYYSTTILSDNNIDNIIKQALDNVKVIDNEDEEFFHDGSGEYKKAVKYKPLMLKVDELDKVELLKSLEKKAYEKDSRVNKVISVSYGYSKSSSVFKNSLGLDLEEGSEVAYAGIYLSAKVDDDIKTGGDSIYFAKDEDFDFDKMIDRAVTETVSKLGSVNVKTGKYSVIFNSDAFAMLLPKIEGLFSAKSVQDKKSKFAGKLEQKVASDIVTIVDDPLMNGGFATSSFDGEGCPTYTKSMIEKGVLKTYFYNLKTAHKDGVKTTGNKYGAFNFYLENGILSADELKEKLKDGVYIDDLSGLHAGYNMITGEMSFGASGFLIKDGKLDKPLSQFTIATNIYDLLFNIKAIANNLDFADTKYGSPDILVSDISIASE